MMIKEFDYYIAWTDAMKYGDGFAGLIGYQHKLLTTSAQILWVVGPNLNSERDAEHSADEMLNQIIEINRFGRVVYADGVML